MQEGGFHHRRATRGTEGGYAGGGEATMVMVGESKKDRGREYHGQVQKEVHKGDASLSDLKSFRQRERKVERRIKSAKGSKVVKSIKSEKGTKLTRGSDLEMSGDMSNEHSEKGYTRSVKESDSNMPGDSGYGNSYSKSGKKIGTKSGKMKVGKSTKKSEKSKKVQSKGVQI